MGSGSTPGPGTRSFRDRRALHVIAVDSRVGESDHMPAHVNRPHDALAAANAEFTRRNRRPNPNLGGNSSAAGALERAAPARPMRSQCCPGRVWREGVCRCKDGVSLRASRWSQTRWSLSLLPGEQPPGEPSSSVRTTAGRSAAAALCATVIYDLAQLPRLRGGPERHAQRRCLPRAPSARLTVASARATAMILRYKSRHVDQIPKATRGEALPVRHNPGR